MCPPQNRSLPNYFSSRVSFPCTVSDQHWCTFFSSSEGAGISGSISMARASSYGGLGLVRLCVQNTKVKIVQGRPFPSATTFSWAGLRPCPARGFPRRGPYSPTRQHGEVSFNASFSSAIASSNLFYSANNVPRLKCTSFFLDLFQAIYR
jgi:hypothetical protein